MGKDEGAALMLRLLLMLLLMEETPGKNDLKGKTAENINLQNSCVPMCISLSCLNHHVKIKMKAKKYFCDGTGAQLWFLQHEAARSTAASTSAG